MSRNAEFDRCSVSVLVTFVLLELPIILAEIERNAVLGSSSSALTRPETSTTFVEIESHQFRSTATRRGGTYETNHLLGVCLWAVGNNRGERPNPCRTVWSGSRRTEE